VQSISLNISNSYRFIICPGVCLGLPSVWMLHCASCELVTEVLGQSVGCVFKGQTVIPFKMWPKPCPDMPVTNYQSTPHDMSKERSPLLHRDGRLKRPMW